MSGGSPGSWYESRGPWVACQNANCPGCKRKGVFVPSFKYVADVLEGVAANSQRCLACNKPCRTPYRSLNLPMDRYQGTKSALGIFQRQALFGLVPWLPRPLLLVLENLKMLEGLVGVGGIVVRPLCRRLPTYVATF